jgi:hypothetical protein
MGIVFEAFDRQRQETVALKTLVHTDAAAVSRLKREFRALANVAHPSLVSLYELFAEGDRWFFTMELVDGVRFTEYVRPPEAAGPLGAAAVSDHPSVLRPDHLRAALLQLTEGVLALHTAGKMHRDLKPSNVLVTRAGRVVILDLGIARDLGLEALPTTFSTPAPGTAHYMSPEQAADGECGPASDWYSVGVMLYEALTGDLPFSGSALAAIARKQIEEAPRLDPTLPERDLVELCQALVARDPATRPTGVDILRALGGSRPPIFGTTAPPRRADLVGRESHLRTLERALEGSRAGRAVTVYVHGLSGMGKSTVVAHFTQRLGASGRAIVLAGRCYDRESVPYKAFDGAIDSLSHYLRTLSSGDLQSLLPQDIHMVARLFPVLRRVDEIDDQARAPFESPEPVEVRRRAVAALAELLARVAARKPLVIHVDDLQWADMDSIALGKAILQQRPTMPLLLVLSFRSEEVPANPVLRSFLDGAGTPAKRELFVGPVSRAESAELAERLLEASPAQGGPLLEVIVNEAGGSPFFIEQLARHAAPIERGAAQTTSLADMVDARIERLPEGARPLLQALAVAARPVDFVIAHKAAGLRATTSDARALIAALRVSNLIRPSGRADRIEIYHDRIRDVIADRVSKDEAERIHRRMAEALSEESVDDPEALFEHYLAAGDIEHAGEHAARAAERAAEALAFDRAALLFRQAIEIGSGKPQDLPRWHAGLGEALANAGRPGEAAQAFLSAAETELSSVRAMRYRRSAAEWLLIGGHNDEGLDVTRTLLREVGLRVPSSPRQVLVSLVLRRLQIRLRGLAYTLRRSQDTSEMDLLRMDICWTCAIGLTMTDYIVAAHFQARYMLLALGVGEPRRVARALAFEVGFVAARGSRSRHRTLKVASMAQALAEELGSPRELGMAAVTTGSAWCLLGDFERAAELCARAETILREQCTGVQWELTTCQIFLLTSLTYLGQTAEVVRRVPLLLDSARERGNLFEGIELRTRQNLYWLIRDEPDEARRELSHAMAQWSRQGFYRQDYNSLLASTQIDLYLGEPSVAWARFEQRWSELGRSQLLRVQLLRCEALHLRARAAIAAAAGGFESEAKLRVAERAARRIARERVSWSAPFEPLLLAGIAGVRGDAPAAAKLLSRAVTGFESARMPLFAAASRRRLGETLGGDEGTQLVAQADAFMRSQAIGDPGRMTGMLAPGFGRQD